MKLNQIICGDTYEVLRTLPDDTFDAIITSPPYWGLRDYGVEGQIGLEPTLDEFLEKLLAITQELQRVLKPTGVMFWNHGDCYGSHRDWTYSDIPLKKQLGEGGKRKAVKKYEKCLMLQNYRLIFKMIDQQGWILRNTIIWHKPNAMPSSVKDRFSNSYEPVFMLVKNNNSIYYYNTKTGLMADRKPKELKEGVDWDWKETIEMTEEEWKEYAEKKGLSIDDRQARVRAWMDLAKGKNRGIKKRKKKSYWKSVKYWFDLDVVRVKQTSDPSKCRPAKGVKHIIDKKTGRLARFKPQEIKYNPAGKNPGDVWKIATHPFSEAHFATFPEKLIIPMIKSSCPKEICKSCGKARVRVMKTTSPTETGTRNIGGRKDGYTTKLKKKWWADKEFLGWTKCDCQPQECEAGIVLDPFMGAGTVGVVAKRLKRNYVGIELNPEYVKMAEKRIRETPTPMI